MGPWTAWVDPRVDPGGVWKHGRRGRLTAGPYRRLSLGEPSFRTASLRLLLRERPAGRRDGEPAANAAVVPQVRQKHQTGLLQHRSHDLRGNLLRSCRPGLLHPGGLPPPAALGCPLRNLPPSIQAYPRPSRPLMAQRFTGNRDAHRSGDAAGTGVVCKLWGGGYGETGAGEAHRAAGYRGGGASGLLSLPVLERHRHAGDYRTRVLDHRGRAGLFPHRVGE